MKHFCLLASIVFLSFCGTSAQAGSREGDSLALVAIMEANPGSGLSWSGGTIDIWDGVTVADDRVSKIDLFGVNIQDVPSDIGQLDALTELTLWGKAIKTLPLELWGMTNLERLVIFYTSITMLPSTISNLQKLELLLIGASPLDSLPPEIWQLEQLKHLMIEGLNLDSISTELSHLINLQSLYIGGNPLKDIPEEVWTLKNLIQLNISDAQIASVSSKVANLTKLESLELDGNKLQEIPKEIGEIHTLEWLRVGRNNLTTLPKEIGNLSNLIVLYLDGNNITELPPEIGNLKNLVNLVLDGNNITKLPPEIGNLTNLTALTLGYNELISLPPEIEKLTKLESLFIQGNLLHFKDIELMDDVAYYSPQKPLPLIISKDSTYIYFPIRGSVNHYTWYTRLKSEGESSFLPIDDLDDDSLYIGSFDLEKTDFKCEAISEIITDLTLYSQNTPTKEEDYITSIFSKEEAQKTLSPKKLFSTFQNSKLTISLTKTEVITIKIFDVKGRIVSTPLSTILFTGTHTLNLKNSLAHGVYLVQVSGGGEELVGRITIR